MCGPIGARGAPAPNPATRAYKTGFACFSLVPKMVVQQTNKMAAYFRAKIQNSAGGTERRRGCAIDIPVMKASLRVMAQPVLLSMDHL